MQTFTKLLLAGLLFAASAAFAQDQISVQSSCAATESADKNQPPAGMIKTGEMTVTNAETGETTTADSYSPPPKSIADLYMEGGYIWMSMITICLIAMLFAAWKAPRWVKEAGLAALMLGWIYFMTGLYDISEIIGSGQLAGISSESKLAILFSGVRVTVIAPTYGMIVYCISLLLRIAVKPRI